MMHGQTKIKYFVRLMHWIRKLKLEVFFTFLWPCIVTKFFIIKPTRCTTFPNLFWHETLHVSGSSLCTSSGVYSLYTQQWYVTHRFVDSFREGPGWNCSSILVLLESCLQTSMTYTIAECTVSKLLMMYRGNFPKHVEFHARINFGN